jgi:hypothetical protein
MVRLWIAGLPIVSLNSAHRDDKAIDAARAKMVSRLHMAREDMLTWLRSCVAEYANNHGMVIVVDDKFVVDTNFLQTFGRAISCEGARGVERVIKVLDDAPLAAMLQISLASSLAVLDAMRQAWRRDFDELSERCSSMTPEWKSAEADLTNFDSDVVATLLLNKVFGPLGEASDLLDKMVSATKAFGGVAFLDEAVVSNAKSISRHSIVTVSLTYALFNIAVALPKVKTPKLKQKEAEKLQNELISKGTWELLPEGIRNYIQSLMKLGSV